MIISEYHNQIFMSTQNIPFWCYHLLQFCNGFPSKKTAVRSIHLFHCIGGIVLHMTIMEYSFTGEWNEKNKLSSAKWIREKLTEIQGVAPEDLFLEYINTMIGNKKTMQEIAKELADFFGEEESRLIVLCYACMLKLILYGSCVLVRLRLIWAIIYGN